MQVEIKTSSIEPLRNTFSHVARRLGGDKPASRYQEATFDLQPEVNFHYRPLWQPDKAIYDTSRTAIVMADWYALKDPRQYYYGSYTITRARQQETMEKNIAFAERRALLANLPQAVREQIQFGLVPLRHYEWGANSNNCYMTAYGWGTAITQATMFHTMDRLALAQYLSRIGLLLDGNTGESLAGAKTLWMEHPSWQPMRRLVENMMATQDWFELFVAQNLVADGLLQPLMFKDIAARLDATNGPSLGLITDFMTTWFDETARWVDTTIKTVAAESGDNAAQITQWFMHWRGRCSEALAPLATDLLGADAAGALDQVGKSLDARVTKLGLKTGESAR